MRIKPSRILAAAGLAGALAIGVASSTPASAASTGQNVSVTAGVGTSLLTDTGRNWCRTYTECKEDRAWYARHGYYTSGIYYSIAAYFFDYARG